MVDTVAGFQRIRGFLSPDHRQPTLLAKMLAALCVFSCVGAMSAPENPPSTSMPYCMPGAACWPKPEVWSAFNQSIGGMLHGPPGRRLSSACAALAAPIPI